MNWLSDYFSRWNWTNYVPIVLGGACGLYFEEFWMAGLAAVILSLLWTIIVVFFIPADRGGGFRK